MSDSKAADPVSEPVPRGLRNNNPGNIRRAGVRYKGEVSSDDTAFKAFSAMEWGIRAIFMLLHTYRVRHGLSTIAAMIGRYAPDIENNTAAYVRFVCDAASVAADDDAVDGAGASLTPETEIDTLSASMMIPLVAAIIIMENGRSLDPALIEKAWQLFIK